jgi:hypothetical protein
MKLPNGYGNGYGDGNGYGRYPMTAIIWGRK